MARVVADGDSLAVTTKVTYRYDPAGPAVLVDTDLTITNEIPPVTRVTASKPVLLRVILGGASRACGPPGGHPTALGPSPVGGRW